MNDIQLYNEIGKNIKKARRSLGITQEKLAEITNYSLSFIANIESNTYQTFSVSAINNIAKALNTSITNLLPKNPIIDEPLVIKCLKCNYNITLPTELDKLLNNIQEMTNKKIRLTCPICHQKINVDI